MFSWLMYFFQSGSQSPWTQFNYDGTHVNAAQALDSFKTWLVARTQYDSMDHAMLFTGLVQLAGLNIEQNTTDVNIEQNTTDGTSSHR